MTAVSVRAVRPGPAPRRLDRRDPTRPPRAAPPARLRHRRAVGRPRHRRARARGRARCSSPRPTSVGLGLAFGPALLAIAIGSVAGSLLLALVAAAGHDRGVPTMVLLRPVLGRYGSYGASAVNVLQLVGWTAFELWAMALFANRVSDEVFGFTAFGLWLALAAVVCTALALIGPVRVVRVWLEKVGAWVVLAACGYLTIYLIVHADDLFRSTTGAAPFGLAVDLVVSLPCRGCRSWPTTTASRSTGGRTSPARWPATRSATPGSTPSARCSCCRPGSTTRRPRASPPASSGSRPPPSSAPSCSSPCSRARPTRPSPTSTRPR